MASVFYCLCRDFFFPVKGAAVIKVSTHTLIRLHLHTIQTRNEAGETIWSGKQVFIEKMAYKPYYPSVVKDIVRLLDEQPGEGPGKEFDGTSVSVAVILHIIILDLLQSQTTFRQFPANKNKSENGKKDWR